MQIYKHIDQTHNKNAATAILPKVLEIVHPKSVIDVGCGTGSFLSVCKDLGIENLLGIDGKWLDKTRLYVDPNIIIEKDLCQEIVLNRKFDLAISLEVAEHLPEDFSDIFVTSLTNLSDVILFSAALPGQGGQNHLNEQWIDYWVEKFEKKNFSFYDVFRFQFWDNPSVDFWYSQNMFLVIKEGTNNFNLQKVTNPKSIVHPELFKLNRRMEEDLALKYREIVWGEKAVGYYLKLLIKSILLRLNIIKNK